MDRWQGWGLNSGVTGLKYGLKYEPLPLMASALVRLVFPEDISLSNHADT